MKRKEHSDTVQYNAKQRNGKIDSSFEKLLKWRESEHLRVLNVAERCGSIRQDKPQLDNGDIKSEVINQTERCKITVIKQ